ncbi:MAG: radical SAM protein [Ignavibacteriae bacterium]|nr:MAG: radical SAM protein [Ignavibacteriota bacterium]
MEFPKFISFTVTNACNLRCAMCGQWSEEGYIKNNAIERTTHLKVEDWKRLADELSRHTIRFVLIRGGEPFLYPGLIELLRYINNKGIFLSIDTNGTVIKKFIPELLQMGNMHITFSVDGPENIHDAVRGVNGSFKTIKENIALFNTLEQSSPKKISRSICFTISRYSYKGLGEMAEVARSLGVSSVNIVPYYYYSTGTGKTYEQELQQQFDCVPFSWKGFHHDDSGIDFDVFRKEFRRYRETLHGIEDFPYMPFTEDEYETWFHDSVTPVGSTNCMNVEHLIDIQPDGNANFCVDFPDYTIGNVLHSSIEELWNSPGADKFRAYRREKPLAVCYRCGAKYISEIKE